MLIEVWISQDVIKADAGHVGVEKDISEIFDNWTSFRPQYMIGSGNNKDCEEWFFDRKCIRLEISSLIHASLFDQHSFVIAVASIPLQYTIYLFCLFSKISTNTFCEIGGYISLS